jgi:hypothetical protein
MRRCNCSGGVTIITTLPCYQACEECFIPANYVVLREDRVPPCGGEHSFSLTSLNNYFTPCTGNILYSLYSFDTDAFNSVSITSGGLLTYEFSSLAEPGKHYSINYRARCDNENLGGYGVIQTSPEDLCLTSNCTPSQKCNKCTGDCENIAIDLSVNIQ